MLALRREKQFARIVLVQAVFLAISGWLVVGRWGAAGMSVVVSVMMLIGLAISEWYVAGLTGVNALPTYALPVATGVLLTPLLVLAGEWWGAAPLVSLMAKTAAACGVFGGLNLLLERRQLGEAAGLLVENLMPGRQESAQPAGEG
jgi:hypothetical protein